MPRPLQPLGLDRRYADAPRSLWTVALLGVAAALCGCASTGDHSFTIFADPGKYEFHSCEQLANERRTWAAREFDLKMLMDKAEQGAGGAVVSVLAYRTDYVAASEELKVIEATTRGKKCGPPGTPRSPRQQRHPVTISNPDEAKRNPGP